MFGDVATSVDFLRLLSWKENLRYLILEFGISSEIPADKTNKMFYK